MLIIRNLLYVDIPLLGARANPHVTYSEAHRTVICHLHRCPLLISSRMENTETFILIFTNCIIKLICGRRNNSGRHSMAEKLHLIEQVNEGVRHFVNTGR